MALTTLSHLDRLLGDKEIACLLGDEADLRAMLAFETALAEAEAAAGLIEPEAARAIVSSLAEFKPDMERLSLSTLKDGVVVPGLVAQLREAIGEPHGQAVHFGATSQDVVDTALAIRLGAVFDCIETRLAHVDVALAGLQHRFADRPLMARSRMQAAIMITVGDRLAVWRDGVRRVAQALPAQRRAVSIVSLAGAAGTGEKFGDKIGAVRADLAARLGLEVPDYVPHADRGRIADFAGFLSRLTGALGKIGMDAMLMAQNGIDQIKIAGAGGSSAMPHKQNPVRAEILVALARYNAVQLSAAHHALLHEQERSGSAWTLEWLVLPSMIEAAGTALLHAEAMLTAVERMGEP